MKKENSTISSFSSWKTVSIVFNNIIEWDFASKDSSSIQQFDHFHFFPFFSFVHVCSKGFQIWNFVCYCCHHNLCFSDSMSSYILRMQSTFMYLQFFLSLPFSLVFWFRWIHWTINSFHFICNAINQTCLFHNRDLISDRTFSVIKLIVWISRTEQRNSLLYNLPYRYDIIQKYMFDRKFSWLFVFNYIYIWAKRCKKQSVLQWLKFFVLFVLICSD